MSDPQRVRFFGIRHHGPGSAKHLVQAFEELKPDCVLIEGPPEANDLIVHVSDPDLVPPVALLIHATADPAKSAFYPFAVFSPEWQAMRWAIEHRVQVRFIDLPVAQSMALQQDVQAKEMPGLFDQEKSENSETESAPDDPWRARVFGREGQDWWNRQVEERQADEGIFEAIAQGMGFLRDEIGIDGHRSDTDRREMCREASMRENIRLAKKQGHQRIAVVCGAWHVPALSKEGMEKHDAATLKGLPKIKVEATWAPWSYPHMSSESGYGAGIDSPGWYEHLWNEQNAGASRAIGWLSRVSSLLRKNGIDCSSAHVIEAVRLTETLTALRGHASPGIEELQEATQTVICFGDKAPLDVIRKELIVGDRIGSVPASMPILPLQKDIEQTQTSLRMKPSALDKVQELDLRTPNDLARSHFLHRLKALGIDWGRLTRVGGKGTFKEAWSLRWEPSFSINVIEASRWGSTVLEASSKKVINESLSVEKLSEMAELIDVVLLANLEDVIKPVTEQLEKQAAITGDCLELLKTIAPLANVFRYGSVRKTNTDVLAHVLDGIVVRVGIALPSSCSDIDDKAATQLKASILQANEAVKLRDDGSSTKTWHRALATISRKESAHPLIRGLAARILLDDNEMSSEEVNQLMGLNLSTSVDPFHASAWIDGFMNRNAMVLLNDETAWSLIDAWVQELSADHFLAIVALLRRTFSEFSQSERRDIATKASQPDGKAPTLALQDRPMHEENAKNAIPFLKTFLGIPA